MVLVEAFKVLRVTGVPSIQTIYCDNFCEAFELKLSAQRQAGGEQSGIGFTGITPVILQFKRQ